MQGRVAKTGPPAPFITLRWPGAVITETSGTTTRLPTNTSLSPALACSTMSLRKMTSMVRGRLPAGTCTATISQSKASKTLQETQWTHWLFHPCFSPLPYYEICIASSKQWGCFEREDMGGCIILTSSVFSCTLARCQSIKVLSSLINAQDFLHTQDVLADLRSAARMLYNSHGYTLLAEPY